MAVPHCERQKRLLLVFQLLISLLYRLFQGQHSGGADSSAVLSSGAGVHELQVSRSHHGQGTWTKTQAI